MTTLNRDSDFLNQALPEMQDYLLSNELYWPLSASLPRLTPGAALLALARLEGLAPDEAREARARFDSIRAKWRSAWEKKVAREISNRVRLWSEFVSESRGSAEQGGEAYPAEVRGRAILQLLTREAPDFPEKPALAQVDAAFKSGMHPADFPWESGLQAVFSKADFWFLYGKP